MTLRYSGANYYYLRNAQNDIIGIADATGNVVVEYTYDAWGNPLTVTGSKASTLGTYNPLRYRSYFYDTETGLYYLQSRYYDPEMGRFISADGYVATGQGIIGNNMYAYCGNNPTNRYDESGVFWHIVAGAAIGAAINMVTEVVSCVINDEKINLTKVLLKGAIGAVEGGLAATGIGVAGMAITSGLSAAAEEIVDQTYDDKPGYQHDLVIKSAIEGAATSIVCGDVGAARKLNVNKQISSQTRRFANKAVNGQNVKKSYKYFMSQTATMQKQVINTITDPRAIAKAVANKYDGFSIVYYAKRYLAS